MNESTRDYMRRELNATEEQIRFVEQVKELCMKHYCCGGDYIIECYSPKDILKEFKTIADVQEAVGLRIEQELNSRWGSDDDIQLKRSKEFDASGEWK